MSCFLVCTFVSDKHQMAEPIGPKFCVRPHMISHDPRKDVCMLKVTKMCVRKFLIFVNERKYIIKYATFFCYCFTLYEEKMLTDRATIKVESSI